MKIKQLLSGVVAFAMLVTAMPVQAFAADDAGEATTWTKDLTVDELYHTVQDQLDENGTIALEDLAGIEAIASDVRDGVTGQLTAIMFDDQQIVLAEQDGSTSYTLTFAEEDTVDAAPAEPAAQPTAEPDAGESVTVPSEPAANDASTESQQTTGPPAQPGVSLTVTEEEVFTTEAEAEAKAQEQGVDPAAVSTQIGEDGQVLGATLTVNETEVSLVTLTYAANAMQAPEPSEGPAGPVTQNQIPTFTASRVEEIAALNESTSSTNTQVVAAYIWQDAEQDDLFYIAVAGADQHAEQVDSDTWDIYEGDQKLSITVKGTEEAGKNPSQFGHKKHTQYWFIAELTRDEFTDLEEDDNGNYRFQLSELPGGFQLDSIILPGDFVEEEILYQFTATPIDIKVVVDGNPMTSDQSVGSYVEVTPDGEDKDNYFYESDDKVYFQITYYDCKDIIFTAKSPYVIEAIDAELVYGQTGCNGIRPTDSGYRVDNVQGGSTVTVYVRTAYSVQYLWQGGSQIDNYSDSTVYVAALSDKTEAAPSVAEPSIDATLGNETYIQPCDCAKKGIECDHAPVTATGKQLEYPFCYVNDTLQTVIGLKRLPQADKDQTVTGWYAATTDTTPEYDPSNTETVTVSEYLEQHRDAVLAGNIIPFYARTTENKKQLTGVTKTLRTSKPETVSNVEGITFQTDGEWTVPSETKSVTLLYAITVSGETGAQFTLKETPAGSTNVQYWKSADQKWESLQDNTSFTLDSSSKTIYVKITYDNLDFTNGSVKIGANTVKVQPGSNAEGTPEGKTEDTTLKATYTVAYSLGTLPTGSNLTAPTDLNRYVKNTPVNVLSITNLPADGYVTVNNETYKFTGWSVSPSTVVIDNNQFNMPASNVTLTAQWQRVYTVDEVLAKFQKQAVAAKDSTLPVDLNETFKFTLKQGETEIAQATATVKSADTPVILQSISSTNKYLEPEETWTLTEDNLTSAQTEAGWSKDLTSATITVDQNGNLIITVNGVAITSTPYTFINTYTAPVAKLSIEKKLLSVNGNQYTSGSVQSGNELTYQITVKNSGNADAKGPFNVTDSMWSGNGLLDSVKFTNANGQTSDSPVEVNPIEGGTVKVTAIPAHSQFIFTYHYIVQMSDEGKTLSNTVTLAKGESEVDQDTVEVPVAKTHCIVTYEYQSGTAGKSLPVDLLPAVPETQIFLVGDQMDKVPVPEKTTIETEDGTWQFRGWYSEGSLLNPPIRIEQDMHIIGLWNFTERQTATLTVNAVNENGDPFYALKNWPKTAEIEIDATYQISVAGNPEGGDVDVPEAITIGDVRYIYDSYGLNEGKLTGTMTKDGVSVDIVYAVDNVGGEDGKTPDDIPDRYQVTVRYDPIDPDQGSVSEPRIEVLTMKDYTDKLGTVTGSVWMSGATATAKSGYAFDYWTMWTSTTNEETNLSETSISTQENQIAAQTIPAVGGSTIAFTAYFKPVVTIDDVLEYFQKEFTVTSGLNEQAIFRFEIANANGQVITSLIQANTQRSGVAVPLQYTGDEKIILQPGTYTLYEVIPQDDASGIIYDQSRIQFIITEDAKILNKEGQALSDYTFKNRLSASSFTITKTVVDKDGKPTDTIYQIGDTVYYQITVDSINTWPTGKTVKVFDQLPAGLALVSAESLDKSITIQSTENNTVVAEAAAKGTIRVTATVLESYDAAYDNIASVDDSDPTTTDDPKTDPVPIKVAALDVQKTLLDNSKVYNVGDTVQYQITFKNIGNVTLKEFDIADTVPNGLKIVDSAWEDGKFNDQLADELKPGEEKTVTVEVQITGYSTVYTNTATVTAKADKNTTIEQDATNDDLKVDAGVIQITPADITIYTGGNGYTGAVTGSATLTSSGLPEPGFYVTLPDALDDALKQAVGHEGDGPLDLSDYVTITAKASDGKDRTWTLERYDNQPDHDSIAYDKYIYRIVPADGQELVRVQFTDDQGKVIRNDEFDIELDTLYQEFDMSIYSGAVNTDTVKIIVDANKDTDNFQAECAVDSTTGKLTVRGVVDEITTDIVNAVPENADNITAIASADTEYWINGSHLEVADGHNVKLLVDEIVEDAQTALRNAIIASPENDFDDDFEFEFKYLDLVDTSNGNVWITPSKAMTVFWPYPNGTDEDTEFQVIHFVGLDRNYDDLGEELKADGAVEYLTDVEYHADGITFTVDSFSPFALVWEDDDDNGGGGAHHPEYDPDDEDDEDDEEEIIDDEVPLAETPWLNTEDHYAYIVGYAEDGTVRPNANITRAEVATIFFRLLTDEARDLFWSTSNNFSDVTADAWYNNAVSTMVNMGIIRGYEDGTFRPNANITRAEFAAIAARFMTSGYDVEDDLFIDIANHWAREDINDAAMAGWIHGYADDTFRPDAVITRAEAVTLVNNVLQRKPDADHMLDSMIKWPDNPEGAWYYEAIQEATNSHDYDLFEDAEYETWTALQENRDWAALEADWLNAHRTGGEVM